MLKPSIHALVLLLLPCSPHEDETIRIASESDTCLIFELFQKKTNPSALDRLHPVYAALGWTTSAFWMGNDSLVFTESRRLSMTSLEEASPEAGWIEPVTVDSGSGPYQPQGAYPLFDARAFLMLAKPPEQESLELVEVGPDFKVRRAIRLDTVERGPLEVKWLYRFAPVGDGILAYAKLAIHLPEKKLEPFHSFVLMNFDGTYKLVGEVVPEDSNLHYRLVLDFPFITSAGDTGYVLVMEDNAWVARVSWDAPQLVRLPTDPAVAARYSKLPKIDWFYDPTKFLNGTQVVPPSIQRNQVYRFYRDVERSTMLAGIHAWQDRLFLLAREAAPVETSLWRLLEIDSETGELKVEHELPTNASNLLLAPGEDFLAILEKSATSEITNPARLTREAFTVKRLSALVPRALDHVDDAAVHCRQHPPFLPTTPRTSRLTTGAQNE